MYVEKINLLNFKNYEALDLSFSPYINIFAGSNGSGKTNLLDAIYYLSLTKSAFNSNDGLNIRHGQSFFSIHGNFVKDSGNYLVQCDYTGKKVLKNNKRTYDKLSEHIGEFPVVLITPYDTDVIREGSEERRKFVDTILSQINHSYLNELIHYNQALKQRNSLLKQFNEKNQVDKTLIEVYDQKLLKSGKIIHNLRKQFIGEFLPLFFKHYENLSEKKEDPGLEYDSQLHDFDFDQKFRKALERDIFLQRTTKGIHKDDFRFTINGHPLKNFGSQGQQKSYVIGLKLAQYEIIKISRQIKPVLLLDDIFDKLDQKRIDKLMEMVAKSEFGQLFITDARLERSEKFFKNMDTEIRIFKIENGRISDVINEK